MSAKTVRLSIVVFWSLLVGLSTALAVPFFQPIFSQTAPVYGAQLLLVRLRPGQVLPADVGVALHARLADDDAARLILSGPPGSGVRLADAGLAIEVLDESTAGQVYYFVDKQKDPSAAVSQAAVFGRILYEDDFLLLLALPLEDETRLVETLPGQGISISLLSPAPLPLEDETPVAIRAASPQSTNPTIAALLPQLTEADLSNRIAQLSGEVPVALPGGSVTLATRYTFSTRILDAERFLHNYYTNLGLSPFYVDWVRGSYSGRNVAVDLPGAEHPERIWVLGGHFDTNSEIPYTSAPGADDNGTGSAAILRSVELLQQYRFADTIRFVHFSGEEQGQWGAQFYARELRLAGAQVQGFINLDMFGWDSNGDRVVELHPGTGVNSNSIATAFISANERYGQGLSFERKTSSASRFSDHSAFWDYNYPAFLVIENFFTDAIPPDRNPWYHTSGDRLVRVNLDYTLRIARTALATIAELAGIRDGTTTPTATPTLTVTPTSSPTATETLTATPTATTTPLPSGCTNLLVNGNFETADSTAWRFGGAYAGRVVTSPVYAGSGAAQLGLPSGAANQYAYSTAYQTVSVSAGGEQLLLTWWERTGGGSDGADYREVLLLNENFTRLANLEQARGAGNDEWRQRSFDVSAYAGRTFVVYFNVYNNGSVSQMWNYLDEVSLLRCAGGTATPTVTATPTATETASLTPSPTASETATPTPTATETETPTATSTPSGTVTETPTPSATPTETATVTATPTATPTPTPTASPAAQERRYLPLILKLADPATSTSTPTPTPTPTATPTPTVSPTPTLSPTPTPTVTPTPPQSPLATPGARG